MRRQLLTALAALTASAAAASTAEAGPSLRGSPAAMQEQNRVARDHGLAFYRTSAEIMQGVESGQLIRLEGNANYEVADFVGHPFAHPAAVLFVERLSAQYHEACGQKLVVTSAVRPMDGQPSNSHRLSVHPTGMALDLRVSDRAACRSWLESALMNMESRGLLNGIRERHPPHYHVALYPEPYMAYAAERMALEAAAQPEPVAEPVNEVATGDAGEEATSAPAIVASDAGSGTPGGPLAATLMLLATLPLVGWATRRGWLRPEALGFGRSPADAAAPAPHEQEQEPALAVEPADPGSAAR